MLDAALIAGLNHLLASANWARGRLRPFAGRHARFDIPPFELAFVVSVEGNLDSGPDSGSPDVTILLPANAAFLLPQGLDKIISLARVEGNAEFATELSFVFRNLRWDAEEDLSRLFGDIAARRLILVAGKLDAWKRNAVARLTANLAEYLVHERTLLIADPEFDLFRTEVASMASDLARIDKRIDSIT